MERETGIEPATNSLEGCDSTTELLPPSRRCTSLPAATAGQARRHSRDPPATARRAKASDALSLTRRRAYARCQINSATKLHKPPRQPSHARGGAKEGWWGGEGSNLRSPKAAGLQPAAIDRSATSPKYISCCSSGHDCVGSQHLYPLRPWAVALKPAHVIGVRVSDVSLKGGVTVHGAGGGIRTPDLLITNQLLYRPELRQPDKEQIIALPVPAEQLDGLSRQIWRGSRDQSGLPQPTPTASII